MKKNDSEQHVMAVLLFEAPIKILLNLKNQKQKKTLTNFSMMSCFESSLFYKRGFKTVLASAIQE